ncbi:hypothetical protein ACHAQA_008638 [Verticillium albo-atrum]
MKFIALIITAAIAATSVSALPSSYEPPADDGSYEPPTDDGSYEPPVDDGSYDPPTDGACKPATYSCTVGSYGQQGWQVCDVTSKWVYAGDCPPHTSCEFNEVNQSPYCI